MNNDVKTVLVTGASGMIGSHAVKKFLSEGYSVIGIDRADKRVELEGYTHIKTELSDVKSLCKIFEENTVDRVIHLAALAHAFDGGKIEFSDYYAANVECARNVFTVCAQKKVPVLFISTADVYGFTEDVVGKETQPEPVSHYAASKALAEDELKKICEYFEAGYDIFRLAPVYTDEVKRDIQKRYYLKYPKIAYIIGDGTEYEFLNIETLCKKLSDWLLEEPKKDIFNIKDEKLINTKECIEKEKEEGGAGFVLRLPRWIVKTGFFLALAVSGKNKYTYLLNKAVNPIRTR